MQGLALFLALWTHSEIASLGHEQWSQREQASAILRAGLPLTLPAIRAAERCQRDAEIVARCRNLERDWQAHAQELAAWRWNECLEKARALRVPGWKYTPYVDMLPKEWPGRWQTINKYRSMAQGGGWCADVPPGEQWHNDRTAMMLYVTDLLMDGVTVDEVLDMYAKTVPIERAYLMGYKKILAFCEVAEEIPSPKGK